MAVKKSASDLPYNSQAEKAALGSALISNEALYSVLSSLEENDFYEVKHRLIYHALTILFEKAIDVDVLTVTEELTNMKALETVGGVNYLQECADSVVAIGSLQFYIDIVLNQAMLRNLITTIRGINESYLKEDIEDVNDFILASEDKIKNATARKNIDTFKKSSLIASIVEKEIAAPKDVSKGDVIGVPSDYPKLDRITQGFQKSCMYIVAARPNIGKTALALNFAYNAAVNHNIPVGIFSIEMNSELLVKRLIGCSSLVNLSKVSTGNLSSNDKIKVGSAIKTISDAPIYIDDSNNLKLIDIIAKSRKLAVAEPRLGMIIVDYLGLITSAGNNRNPDSRQEEVRKISLALKGLARELEIPIIVVSQLSRAVEQRGENKRPLLSDLRDSGSIEQDADVVMLLYREDYYKNQQQKSSSSKKAQDMTESERFEAVKELNSKGNDDPTSQISYVEINVAKNRNGQTGQCGLFFYRNFGKFDSPTEEWERQMSQLSDEMNSK